MYDRPDILIGGEWRKPSVAASIDVVNPATVRTFASAALASPQDADATFAIAREVVEQGNWARTSPKERIGLMRSMAEHLRPLVDDILHVVTMEMGLPIRLSRALHGLKAIESIHQACDAAEQMVWSEKRGGVIPAVMHQEPVGVVVAIAPWNGPFLQALYKIVYPLLAGCPVIYKPALETPLNAYFVAEAFEKAGLPKGLLSILPGDAELGRYLVSHRDTDAVFFTGSTAAGRNIGGICGQQMKRMVLELGGKSAAIVRADADLEKAVPLLSSGAFGNTGQNCAATSRILVHASRHDELVQRLKIVAETLTVGDPLSDDTDLGPLISQRQRDRVEDYVAIARREGGTIVTGGERPDLQGWFYKPTVITGLGNDSRLAQEEIFGPVVCVIPHADDEDAIRLANDSEYGLHGAVFTSDDAAAERIVRRIRTGTMSVNAFILNGEAPFGGVKQSGVGRKYGVEGLREFLEPKVVNYGSGAATFGFRKE